MKGFDLRIINRFNEGLENIRQQGRISYDQEMEISTLLYLTYLTARNKNPFIVKNFIKTMRKQSPEVLSKHSENNPK